MSFNPDNMKVTSGRDSNYKSGDVKGRPTTDPNGRKDFKKILENSSDDDEEKLAAEDITEETDGIIAAAVQAGAAKKKPGSLFDLTSHTTNAFDENRPLRSKEDKPIKSPADIYGKLAASEKKVTKESNVDSGEKVDDLTVDEDKDEKVDFDADVPVAPVKPNYTTRFSTEQTDISYVNPLAAASNQPSVNLSISNEKLVVPVSNIQEIINQMIEKVTEMKNTGSTETVVTLKHPPMFEGAKIVVTAFDSAKNEFNISIENLTQAGKQLMDQEANKNNLLLALEQKGYAVHIFNTTTVTENRVADALPQQDQQQQGRQQGNPREGKQQRGQQDQS